MVDGSKVRADYTEKGDNSQFSYISFINKSSPSKQCSENVLVQCVLSMSIKSNISDFLLGV
jgi:hypothetical protein